MASSPTRRSPILVPGRLKAGAAVEAYVITVLSMAGIYAILAISYDMMFGFAGMFSIAHGAFFGIGAYAGALAMLKLGVPFLPAVALGAAVAALVGSIIAVPARSLSL